MCWRLKRERFGVGAHIKMKKTVGRQVRPKKQDISKGVKGILDLFFLFCAQISHENNHIKGVFKEANWFEKLN